MDFYHRFVKKTRAVRSFYQDVLQNTPVGILACDRVFRLDSQFRLTFLSNPSFSASAPGKVPIPLKSVVLPEQWDFVHKKLQSVWNGESVVPFKTTLISPSGKRLRVEILLKAITDDKGKTIEIQGSSRTIPGHIKLFEELRDSEARFRIIAENFQSGIAIFKDDSFLYLNPVGAQILEIQQEDAPTLKWKPFIHPDDRQMVVHHLSDIVNGSIGSIRLETRITTQNGKNRWVDFNAKMIDSDGGFVVLTNFIDITDRKKMEIRLRHSEEKYRNLVESEVTGFFVYDGTKFLYFNQYLTQITEYSAHELQKLRVWDLFVHKEEIEKLRQNASMRLKGESPPPLIEFSIRTKSGRIRDILGYVSHVIYESQPAIQGILLDITEKKQLERQLAEQAKIFTAIYNATNNGLSIITPDYRIERANKVAFQLYGSNVEGRHCYEVFQHRDSVCPFCPTKRTFETGESQSEVVPYPDAKHPTGYISLRTYPLKDEEGKITRVIENYQDVTEQKKLEEKLIQAQKMESVGTLAAGIAHDFNNLLGGIIGYTSLIQLEDQLDDSVMELINAIEDTAKRASNLTKQLLGFARKGKYENKPVQLNDILDEVYGIITLRLQKKITIKRHYAKNLKLVMGDPSQFQQVLLNICLNAIDAMPDGGTLTLRSECIENDPSFRKKFPQPTASAYVHIAIRDTGVGMDSDTLSKIFDPFFTTKSPGKGTGLGLSMVYGIIKNHNGFLDVESEIGVGTEFHIYLPAKKTSSYPKKGKLMEKSFQSGKGRILIVDDEDVIRTVLSRMLVRMGFSVSMASDGQEAIQLFRESPENFDLIIIDMLMPVMDGKETFQALKSLDPHVRVLLSTGYTLDESAQSLIDQGVLGYLHKPYNINELSKKLEAILFQKETVQL
ncbi:MAG: PAS domain S-box protein [Calditrichaeota bacterium]|nr:PAS domain S-box protein [Calditrichota bacterium]